MDRFNNNIIVFKLLARLKFFFSSFERKVEKVNVKGGLDVKKVVPLNKA